MLHPLRQQDKNATHVTQSIKKLVNPREDSGLHHSIVNAKHADGLNLYVKCPSVPAPWKNFATLALILGSLLTHNTTFGTSDKADFLVLLDNSRSMSLTLKDKNTTSSTTKLEALQQGVARWLEQNSALSVGFMQYTSPGAAVVAPIEGLTTPTHQVSVRDESTLINRPEQHVTGRISVLAGRDQPHLRLWSKATDTTLISPLWHRLTKSMTQNASFFERLGISNSVTTIFKLSQNQTSIIPLSPIQFDKNKAIEQFRLEWRTNRDINSPITLELALVPYANRNAEAPTPNTLMATARKQGKTITWHIRPRATRTALTTLRSPSLQPLLSKNFFESAASQELALLIHVNALEEPITVKSTTQEDGTAEPLTLNLVTRRFTLKRQAVVKFWFDYMPVLQSSAPHTAFIRAVAWKISEKTMPGKKRPHKTTGLDQLPQAQLYLQKPTSRGPAHPAPLTDQPNKAIIDVFSSPQAWRTAEALGPLFKKAKNKKHPAIVSFRTSDLSWLLSGLTFADAPDLHPEDQRYRHYDPVAFYLPLPETFTKNDIQNLSDRIHGTPATLSLLNNTVSHKESGPNYTANTSAPALFEYELARMHTVDAKQQKSAALFFTPLAITRSSSDQSNPHKNKSRPPHRQDAKFAPSPQAKRNTGNTLRAWVQIPLTRQSAAHKRALTNVPIGMQLAIKPYVDVQSKASTHTPITQTLWTWRSFNTQQQETVNLDISAPLAQLRASPDWQAGHGVKILARPLRHLHYPLLDWTQAKILVQSPKSAFNANVTFSTRSQLLQTLEMLQPLMRGALTDALLEASLFYTQQPPLFGQARQRFPSSDKRPPPRYSRISHPTTIRDAQIVQPAGCSPLSPDAPPCAKEYYAGQPKYRHDTAHCRAQHLILISDGNPPVNHSQSVAAALMQIPSCQQDSLVASEQCGRTLARWLGSRPSSQSPQGPSRAINKPQVRIHTLAFGTNDEPTQRYLYDIAKLGRGLYSDAKNASDITDFLNEVVTLSEQQVLDFQTCSRR